MAASVVPGNYICTKCRLSGDHWITDCNLGIDNESDDWNGNFSLTLVSTDGKRFETSYNGVRKMSKFVSTIWEGDLDYSPGDDMPIKWAGKGVHSKELKEISRYVNYFDRYKSILPSKITGIDLRQFFDNHNYDNTKNKYEIMRRFIANEWEIKFLRSIDNNLCGMIKATSFMAMELMNVLIFFFGIQYKWNIFTEQFASQHKVYPLLFHRIYPSEQREAVTTLNEKVKQKYNDDFKIIQTMLVSRMTREYDITWVIQRLIAQML